MVIGQFIEAERNGQADDPAVAEELERVTTPGAGGMLLVPHREPGMDESALPVHPEVNGACEMLGIDPIYVANEGKFLAVVAPEEAEAAVAALRSHPLGREAAEVGEITDRIGATVALRTGLGGTRIVDMLVGDPLPRIC